MITFKNPNSFNCFNALPDLFPLWHNAIAALFQVTSPIPVKVLMTELAVISTATLRLPLCQEELASDHNLHTIHQKIQQWAANQLLKNNGEASFAFEPIVFISRPIS